MRYAGKLCVACLLGVLNSTFAIPGRYTVHYSGNEIVAKPLHEGGAEQQLVKIVDATDCPVRIQDNRIELKGSCKYLAALYHYIPKVEDRPTTQVVGGFAFSRKSADSYILQVAEAMEFYRKAQVKSGPVPPEWQR